MEQLNLFDLDERNVLDVDVVDISTLREDPYRMNGKGSPYSEIIPEKYYIYKTGGLHRHPEMHKFGKVFPYVTIKSKNNKIIIAKQYVGYTDPYPTFSAKTINGNNCLLKIHRIVAFAFLKKHSNENFFLVDHINGNILDYRLENLRWVDHSNNKKGTKSNAERTENLTNLLNKERDV